MSIYAKSGFNHLRCDADGCAKISEPYLESGQKKKRENERKNWAWISFDGAELMHAQHFCPMHAAILRDMLSEKGWVKS